MFIPDLKGILIIAAIALIFGMILIIRIEQEKDKQGK
jgi:hypothetical protein